MSSHGVKISNELAAASTELNGVTKKCTGLVTFDEMIINGDRYIIRAKIIRLWQKWTRSAGHSIEMVLADEKGNRIHATIEDHNFKKYEKELSQGLTITINTFDIQSNAGDYRTSDSPFRLIFFPTTRVRPYVDFPAVVEEKYYQDLDVIKSGSLDPNVLIDVVAQITNVGPVEESNKNGRKTTRVTVDLRDYLNTTLKCTLFDSYAKQMIAYADKHPSPQPVCVFRLVCVKEYKNVWSITNAYNATELIFDDVSEKVQKFKRMLPTDTYVLTRSESSTSYAGGSNLSIHEEFLGSKFTRATIDEILCSTNVGICVVLAKIVSIGESNKWYYIACKCKRKVAPYPEEEVDGVKKLLFMCPKCGDVEYAAPRYLLSLNVSDDSGGEAKFVLFDDMAEKLLDISAALLREEVPKDDPTMLPSQLTDLIGKTLLFKITIEEKNIKSSNASYKVNLICQDDELLIAFENERIVGKPKATLLLTNDDGLNGVNSDGTPKRWWNNENSDTKSELSYGTSNGTPSNISVTPKSKFRTEEQTGPQFDDKGSVTKKIKMEDEVKIGDQSEEEIIKLE